MIEWEHFCSLFMIVNQLFVIIICLHVDNVSPGEPSPNSSCNITSVIIPAVLFYISVWQGWLIRNSSPCISEIIACLDHHSHLPPENQFVLNSVTLLHF